MKKQFKLAVVLVFGVFALGGCNSNPVVKDSKPVVKDSKPEKLNLPFTERYIISEDGSTVYDQNTNLTWMRCSMDLTWNGEACEGEQKSYRLPEAQEIIKQSRFAGRSDWRIPTLDELGSLVYCSSGGQKKRIIRSDGTTLTIGNTSDDLFNGNCRGVYMRPTIFTPVFPDTRSAEWSYWSFWTASRVPKYDDYYPGVIYMQTIRFNNGSNSVSWSTLYNNVRLVRTGK